MFAKIFTWPDLNDRLMYKLKRETEDEISLIYKQFWNNEINIIIKGPITASFINHFFSAGNTKKDFN